MGTNYYMTIEVCACCGRGSEKLHIGKSSGGWTFALNTHPDHGIFDLDDWISVWANKPITNEYGESISTEEMERIINERQWRNRPISGPPLGYPTLQSWYDQNQSEPGPNGLSRRRIDGTFCIAHGEGTYDLMRGEFS